MFLTDGSSLYMVAIDAECELGVRFSMKEPCSVCADATDGRDGNLKVRMAKALEWPLWNSAGSGLASEKGEPGDLLLSMWEKGF